MIDTERLILRGWQQCDEAPFAAMGADEEVMRHLGGVADDPVVQARETIERQQAVLAEQGHCFWAIERKADGALLGFCGLRVGGHAGTLVTDELEIGWRLRRDAWGNGYAREAAAACIAWGWANTQRSRIAAWTVSANAASWGLMIRLGMTHRPELDFDHPSFPLEHPLSRHVVYVIDRP